MEAVFAVENYIYQCNPESGEDLEGAVFDIVNAATAALISVIGPKDTKDFLEAQAESIRHQFSRKAKNNISWDIVEGLH